MLFLNNRLTLILLVLIALIGLSAFLGLSFYNHPTIDDFGHADFVKRYGIWEAQKFQFQNRTGRFASTLTVALLNPLIYTHWLTGIKAYPVFFLISFILAFHSFLFLCFHKQLPFFQIFPFSLALFVCFILELESVLELFYWFAANCVYGIPMLLFLVNGCLFIKLLQDRLSQKVWPRVVGIGIAGVILCGSNELDLVNIILLNLLMLVYLVYTGPKKLAWGYLVCFLIIAGAAFFSLSAPGNMARAKTLNDDLPSMLSLPYFGSIFFTATKYVLLKSKNWIFSLPLISASALLAVLIWKYQLKAPLRFKNFKQVLIYMGLVYAILILQIFPVLYNRGLSGLVDRAANVIWFHFFLYWLIGIFLFIPFLRDDCKITVLISRKLQIRFFHVILTALLAAVLSSFHIGQAYQDLFFKAPAYDAGLKKRYETFRLNKQNNHLALEVRPIFPHPQDYPKSISKLELSQDPDTYFNSSVASYFGLHSVKLAAPPPLQGR